jgi:Family of unknown function (DUF5681)
MRFQPGQSGNPAGRLPGSLNKKTIALEEAFAEGAQEVVADVITRAKNGDEAAVRLCVDRMLPRKRDRAVAIELPVIKTSEDAELALTVVTDELAAGHLTIGEASALVALIDRMLRVAERMWKFARARRYADDYDAVSFEEEAAATEDQAVVETGDPEASQTAEKPGAPLYSPVNSQGEAMQAGRGGENAAPKPVARETAAPPLPQAA